MCCRNTIELKLGADEEVKVNDNRRPSLFVPHGVSVQQNVQNDTLRPIVSPSLVQSPRLLQACGFILEIRIIRGLGKD